MQNTNPIAEVKFKGLSWIEASAGTGKTHALTGIIVRALMTDYLPNQVLATTFTRAATAELKARVRSGLIGLLRFLESRTDFTASENLTYADSIADNQLHSSILKQYADKVLFACERAKLVLSQMDYLYIGTLDSLSQKLLREFAFESGKIERAEITDNSKKYTAEIIHDALRGWIADQDQALIDLMLMNGCIKTVETYVKLVEDSLSFYSAEFLNPPQIQLNTDEVKARYGLVKDFDLAQFEPYFLDTGIYFKGISGTYFKPTTKFGKIFGSAIPSLLKLLANEQYSVLFSADFGEHKQALCNFLKLCRNEKLFSSKIPQEAHSNFYGNEQIVRLCDLIAAIEEVDSSILAAETCLKHYLCQQAKIKLPDLLQQKRETTFAQQIRTLGEALQGKSGEVFAQAVHKQYPLLIVDEYQDTNQEQDNALALIWRDKTRLESGGMILVGDRKQAIYGFRGGDMLTFINAYNDVEQKGGLFYRLGVNYRTVPNLVRAVDALFTANFDFGEGVEYTRIEPSARQLAVLVDRGQANPAPLRWLRVPKEVDAYVQIGQQVLHLLKQGQNGELYFEQNDQQQPMGFNDIAVLAKNNDDLDKIQYELERIGIPVNRASKRSVFDSRAAQDIAAVLLAINEPSDVMRLRRALLTPMFGLKVSRIKELEESADGLGHFIAEFHRIRDTWMRIGFLSAWQQLVSSFDIWTNSITSSGKDSERSIVNLRHIVELLGQYSARHTGMQSLTQWYFNQISLPGQREWELERSLSNDEGVKLLTIHKSKGLEFKVVFLFKADSGIKESSKTLNYSTQTTEKEGCEIKKRVVAVGDSPDLAADQIAEHKARLEAENHRQWYVALTRASHRMYVMMHSEKPSLGGVGYWRNAENFKPHAEMVDAECLEGFQRYQRDQRQVYEVHGLDLPKTKYFPTKTTSFSGLCQHLNSREAEDFLVASYSGRIYEDESDAEFSTGRTDNPLPFINGNYAKGMLAGTALHNFLDLIDFTKEQDWNLEIYRRFKNGHFNVYVEMRDRYLRQFPALNEDQAVERLIADLVTWLGEITSAKIEGELRLKHLPANAYLSEMPFVLSMRDEYFDSADLSKLMAEYGYIMPDLNRAETARFMNGSIDIVYQYKGRFFVGDYKGNYLGADFADYSNESMHMNMLQSSYHLQAALYLVALHRYLKKRIKDYSIEQHLGGATYMYLRGMQADQTTGVYQWNPPCELILRMDQLLGAASMKLAG